MTEPEDHVTQGWRWPHDAPGAPRPGDVVGGVRLPSLDPGGLDALLEHLDRAGEALARRPVAERVAALGTAGERLLERHVSDLARAVARESLLSEVMAERVVAGMAQGWTRDALGRLLASELQDGAVLDGFVARDGRRVRAVGRGATLHVGSGSVPGVSATSLIRALLVGCPSVVKPGRGDLALTTGYLDVLEEVDPATAAAAAVVYWPGGEAGHEGPEMRLLDWARQVVVYGGDEAVRRLRGLAPPSTEVVVHPNRIGVIVADPEAAPEAVAEAVATFDQRGCVSPQIALFLGDGAAADAWARKVADALAAAETRWPPGPADPSARSSIHQQRGSLELRSAAGDPLEVHYRNEARWTVLRAPLEDVVPLGDRSLWIVPCPRVDDLVRGLEALGPVLQSVGVALAAGPEAVVEAAVLAGASRVVPIEAMAFPEADWLHDGRGPLRELVRWAEWRD